MLTGGSGMLDSQLSTEVKFTALFGLSFSPSFCFAKRANVFYILKEAVFNISIKQKMTTSAKRLDAIYPLNECLLCPHGTDFW